MSGRQEVIRMTAGFQKLVDFTKCSTCKFETTAPDEEPCNECLSNPARDGEESHTPINWKPKDK